MHMQFVQVFLPTMQGDPIEWVSDHRYHHAHTDTPLDPHSPYDGYFWAHIGWLWDNEVCGSILHFTFHITVFLVTSILPHKRHGNIACHVLSIKAQTMSTVLNSMICSEVLRVAQILWPKKGAFENVNDLKEQAFYRFIAKTYWGHIALQFALLYAVGGWPWFVWLGCIRVSCPLCRQSCWEDWSLPPAECCWGTAVFDSKHAGRQYCAVLHVK